MSRSERTLRLPEFGQNLDRAMKAQRMTQDELAIRLGVKQGTVSRWLAGTLPNKAMLEKIAREVGQTWKWLLTADAGAKVEPICPPSGVVPAGRAGLGAAHTPTPPTKRKRAKMRPASSQ